MSKNSVASLDISGMADVIRKQRKMYLEFLLYLFLFDIFPIGTEFAPTSNVKTFKNDSVFNFFQLNSSLKADSFCHGGQAEKTEAKEDQLASLALPTCAKSPGPSSLVTPALKQAGKDIF